MKKQIHVALIALFLAAHSGEAVASLGDTIGRSNNFLPKFAPQGKVATLKDGQGGYVFGIGKQAPFKDQNQNPLGVIFAFGQGYENSNPIKITHVLSHISYKKSKSATPSSKLSFTIHPMQSNKAYDGVGATSPNVDGPGMQYTGSANLDFNNITTGPNVFNVATFSTPVAANGPIAIVCDLSDFLSKGDTVGFYSDLIGDGYGLTWRAVDIQNFWKRFYTASTWNSNVNVALFAVVAENTSVKDIDDATMVNGVRALVFPNPCADYTRVKFQTTAPGNWDLELISGEGKVIRKEHLGYKNNGTHESMIDLSGLSAGNYFYSLIHENGQRYTKTLVIER